MKKEEQEDCFHTHLFSLVRRRKQRKKEFLSVYFIFFESGGGGGGEKVITLLHTSTLVGNMVKNGGRILHNTFYTLSYSLSASLFSFVSGEKKGKGFFWVVVVVAVLMVEGV